MLFIHGNQNQLPLHFRNSTDDLHSTTHNLHIHSEHTAPSQQTIPPSLTSTPEHIPAPLPKPQCPSPHPRTFANDPLEFLDRGSVFRFPGGKGGPEQGYGSSLEGISVPDGDVWEGLGGIGRWKWCWVVRHCVFDVGFWVMGWGLEGRIVELGEMGKGPRGFRDRDR